jgi:hypothetical protein
MEFGQCGNIDNLGFFFIKKIPITVLWHIVNKNWNFKKRFKNHKPLL